jgi:hypothetical protein
VSKLISILLLALAAWAQYPIPGAGGGGGGGTVTAGTGITVVGSTVSADTAVMQSRATAQSGTSTYCRSTTGNDTYTCSLTPTLTAYTTGMCLLLNADTANTGAATINVDALGAKSILGPNGGALTDVDIPVNKPVQICYDGTQFILQTNGTGGGSINVTGQTTTLNGAINSAVTSLVVSAAFTSMPSTPFWIMVGSEQMKVTGVAGTTWTVARGDGGTTAASQSNGATITEMVWFWSQKASTTSYQNNGGFLQLMDTATQGTGQDYSIRMLTKLQYSAPWTVIAKVSINNSQAANYVGASFCLWDAANPTKAVATYSAQFSSYWRGVSQLFSWNTGGFYTEVTGWSWTSPWTAPQPTVQPTLSTAQWIKLVDNSTNWLLYVSDDKSNWTKIGQVARNTYITPGYAGITINNRGSWIVATLSSFEQYNSVI